MSIYDNYDPNAPALNFGEPKFYKLPLVVVNGGKRPSVDIDGICQYKYSNDKCYVAGFNIVERPELIEITEEEYLNFLNGEQ